MKKIFLVFIVLFLILLTWCSFYWKGNNESVVNNNIDLTNNNSSQNVKISEDTLDYNEEKQSSWTIIKHNLSDVWSKNKYCMLDECIILDADINEEWNYYIASYSTWTQDDLSTYKYKLSKNFDYFELELKELMSTETTKIFKVWDNYVKYIDTLWCWGSNLVQKVYDKDFNELSNFLLSTHQNSIKIWNITYSPSLILNWWFWQPLDSFNDYKIYHNKDFSYKIYNNEKEFSDFVNNKVINEEKKIYKSYIANYTDYPWIYVVYNSVWYDNSSMRVVWLWTDEDYLNKNIKENGDFFDLTVTNKIIWYYGKDNLNEWFFDKDGNRITSVTSKDLPIFKMTKLNNDWNYLVYTTNWQKVETYAEMCKPVVYYYSKYREENTLSLNLKKWDYFTKLIPNLDENNSWNFLALNWNIYVNNKDYDYLYYSLVTLWYKHNRNGWIVSWKDIVKFFEDKLNKINFNSQEKIDFIDFWKGEYENDKYYFISFKYKDDLDNIVRLDFKKKVDSEFRVLLDSYEIKEFDYQFYKDYLYENVWNKFDKYLIKRFERWNTSNEVFEWGWVLRKENEIIIK